MSPEPASYDPEEFVDGSQSWPRLLAFKDGELLAKGEVFEHQTAVRPKQAKHGSEPEPKQVKHGNQVIAERLCRLPDEVVDFKAGQDCDEAQIYGGIHATLFPEEALEHGDAHAVVKGDGDIAWGKVVTDCLAGKPGRSESRTGR